MPFFHCSIEIVAQGLQTILPRNCFLTWHFLAKGGKDMQEQGAIKYVAWTKHIWQSSDGRTYDKYRYV